MATTGTGVVYTPEYGVTSDGGACRWYMRDDRKASLDPVPVLLFLHGGGGSVESFGHATWATLRNLLIDAGWAVVEGDGGLNWGGPTVQGLYLEMWDWMRTKVDPGVLVIMGQSMGGIGTYNLGAFGPISARHSAIIIQNGTTDLIARYSDHNRPAYPGLNAAFGVSGSTYQPEAFELAASPYDPMQFDPSVWAGKRVRQIVGMQDTSVAPGPHGLAWVDKYGDATLDTSVFVSDPGGHTPLAAQQVSTFAYMQALIPPPPVPDPTRVYEIASIAPILV